MAAGEIFEDLRVLPPDADHLLHELEEIAVLLLLRPVDHVAVEPPFLRDRVLVPPVEVVHEETRSIVPLLADIPERDERREDRLIRS